MGNHRAISPVTLLLAVALSCLLGGAGPARAQSSDGDPTVPERPNPLEPSEPDPLTPAVDRPLTPLEQSTLRADADELAAEARREYDAGEIDKAFDLWYRSLRLRRPLGPAAEVPALGDVGEIAWEARARKFDIQVISKRLIDIQATLPQRDRDSTLALATAFEQLRLSDRAAALYEEVLPATPAGDREPILEKIARLHQDSFAYQKAAAAYEQLLDLARARSDRLAQTRYLRELTRLYDLADRPENSARSRERLLAQYAAADDTATAKKIPALLVDIGRDYAALNRADVASSTYQDAYQRALSLGQYAVASDALVALGELYENAGQLSEATRTYTELVRVRQQSSDSYGLVETYDRLGELYLTQDDPERALEAFERALELAESLSYDPERFTAQIERARDRLP